MKANSNDFFFESDNDSASPEKLEFSISPKSQRDHVAKEVQVLTSDRILGYNTYNGILAGDDKIQASMEDGNSDYYNVTVNFIVKRSSQFATDAGSAPTPAPEAAPTKKAEPAHVV